MTPWNTQESLSNANAHKLAIMDVMGCGYGATIQE